MIALYPLFLSSNHDRRYKVPIHGRTASSSFMLTLFGLNVCCKLQGHLADLSATSISKKLGSRAPGLDLHGSQSSAEAEQPLCICFLCI